MKQNGSVRAQSPGKLILLNLMGILLIVIGCAVWIVWSVLRDDLGALGGAVAGAIGAGTNFAGRELINYAKRLTRERDGNVTSTIGAVVYLRSFCVDRRTAEAVGSDADFGALKSILTEEEQLVAALSSIAPVIAVGNPDERLPPLGATRVYFLQNEWQAAVSKLIREASLVVIRPGAFSPSVRWEIQESINNLTPERLVLIVDGRTGKHQDADLAQFASALNPMLAREMASQSYENTPLLRLGSVRAFIRFDEGWSPVLLPIAVRSVPLFKRSTRSRLTTYFKATLSPVLIALGHPSPDLPISMGMVSIAVGFGLLFLLGAFQVVAIVFTR